MVVRIRLARFGCKNKPFYRVMAADSRSPRDGKHLEVLGYYNPLPGQDGGKRMGLNFERVNRELKGGALFTPSNEMTGTTISYFTERTFCNYTLVILPIA
ncbi:hypothetical protein UlMin_004492 [Ulmus minor]